ncbi:hypothetical protein FGG08_006790 [Glutinoglossum americanum]|uniref:MPN domain-containing protein n=1 Tax=Glutinoglossum americanum TaxID=1670608 RepID=A0A9P8L0M3_9PEZI|nr:hypothetical protein FGG08_006790 [Glutinoglossum americanum]
MDIEQGAWRPLSVPEIIKRAEEFEYNPLISLKYWLRTADALQKEAGIYEREGNNQQAYLLLFRRAKLVIESLANHPERNLVEFRDALKATERQTQASLAKLESLKPRITARYDRYATQARAQEGRRQASANERGHNHTRGVSSLDSMLSRISSDPAVAGSARPIAAAENGDLAVKLAQKELSRRRATRKAGISEAEERARRSGGVWGDWEEALSEGGWKLNGTASGIPLRRGSREDELAGADLRRRMMETRRKVDSVRDDAVQANGSRGGVQRDSPTHSVQQPSSGFNYPSVPKRSNSDAWAPPPRIPPKYIEQPYGVKKPTRSSEPLSERPPELPPKENFQIDGAQRETWPTTSNNSGPPRPGKGPPAPLSTFDIFPRSATPTSADLNPSTFTFKPSAYLENGAPLRTVFLPPDLRYAFLKIAAPNTRNNLETCGILCGTLISNALFISRLVIPDQESTSDTCDTINESALFDYCDSEDLMVLGWIHTHPTQTCFMSSRDLHTHCGYQVMMPESIAIVCAPSKDPSWGIFRLTDPPGMQTVLKCQQTGLFHPHGEENVYTDALRPGHVFEAHGMEFEVVDLRPQI